MSKAQLQTNNTQYASLIEALIGKAGGASVETCTVTVENNSDDSCYVTVTRFVDGKITDADYLQRISDGDTRVYDNVVCGSGISVCAVGCNDGIEDPSDTYSLEGGRYGIYNGSRPPAYDICFSIYKAPESAGAAITISVS